MTAKEFDALLNRRQVLSRDVLAAKAGEYASDMDRLHNFRAAARVQACSPEVACVGMMTKHFVSVLDIVRDIEVVLPSQELLDEKIGDIVNYLHLLEGLIVDRIAAAAPVEGK